MDLLRPLAHRSQVLFLLLVLLLHQGSDLSPSLLGILRLMTATRILIKALPLPAQELRCFLVCFPISHQGLRASFEILFCHCGIMMFQSTSIPSFRRTLKVIALDQIKSDDLLLKPNYMLAMRSNLPVSSMLLRSVQSMKFLAPISTRLACTSRVILHSLVMKIMSLWKHMLFLLCRQMTPASPLNHSLLVPAIVLIPSCRSLASLQIFPSTVSALVTSDPSTVAAIFQ